MASSPSAAGSRRWQISDAAASAAFTASQIGEDEHSESWSDPLQVSVSVRTRDYKITR